MLCFPEALLLTNTDAINCVLLLKQYHLPLPIDKKNKSFCAYTEALRLAYTEAISLSLSKHYSICLYRSNNLYAYPKAVRLACTEAMSYVLIPNHYYLPIARLKIRIGRDLKTTTCLYRGNKVCAYPDALRLACTKAIRFALITRH